MPCLFKPTDYKIERSVLQAVFHHIFHVTTVDISLFLGCSDNTSCSFHGVVLFTEFIELSFIDDITMLDTNPDRPM